MTGSFGLSLAEEGGASKHDQWKGVSRILGPKWSQLPLLTIGLLGAQLMWSVEFSYASPYLLSLGLSKSWMATVFLAGPISGLVMQPLIGVLADNSRSRFGRRRPYMLGGAIITVFGLLLLGYTRPIASVFTTTYSSSNDRLTIAMAVLAIYCIDFSINAVQAVDRALIVDTLPTSRQDSGNAWAARMLGIGSVAGFFIGNVNLTGVFPFLGMTQLEVLSVITSLIFFFAHVGTAVMVKEKVLVSSSARKKSFLQEIRDLWTNLRTLPRVIRQICIIQFCSWIAWFPVLFYTTVYVGELFKSSQPPPAPNDSVVASALDAEATRLGSRALFYSAIVTLIANVVMPTFVREDKGNGPDARRAGPLTPLSPQTRRWWRRKMNLAELWAFSQLLFGCCMLSTFFIRGVTGATVMVTFTGFSWAITQWAPFSLLAQAILSEPASGTADDGASILLTDSRTRSSRDRPEEEHQFLVGDDEEDDLPNGGGPINGRIALPTHDADADTVVGADDDRAIKLRGSDDGDDSRSASLDLGGEDEDEGEGGQPSPLMMNPNARGSHVRIRTADLRSDPLDAVDPDAAGLGHGGLRAKAGIILGIHNAFVVVPQFLVTGLSSIIFAILEPEKSVLHGDHPGKVPPSSSTNTGAPLPPLLEDLSNSTLATGLVARAEVAAAGGANSIAIIFRIGGVMALVAFVLCWRLARELRRR